MTPKHKIFILLLIATSAFGCSSFPKLTTALPNFSESREFQCHSASPGPCNYAIFNEGGSIREAFTLAPGESRKVNNIQARTAFCLAANKPLAPATCERLGLNGKPLSK